MQIEQIITHRLFVEAWKSSERLQDELESLFTPSVLEYLPRTFQATQAELGIQQSIKGKLLKREYLRVSLKPDHRFIGFVVLAQGATKDESLEFHISYAFIKDVWGQGLATELLHAILAHLEAVAPCHLFAAVNIGNEASFQVLRKLGFVEALERTSHNVKVYVRLIEIA